MPNSASARHLREVRRAVGAATALDAEPKAVTVKRWLQGIAGGGVAVLAVFWIRSASISSPAIELVDSMPPPAASEEVAPIEPPPAKTQIQTSTGPKRALPPHVEPRRKLCATRPSGLHATRRPGCGLRSTLGGRGACAAGCAGR
jgi:hypothetical protein